MFKRNFKTVFLDYCDNTTLHGYKYLVIPNRKIYERLIWVAMILGTVFGTLFIFHVLLADYYSSPTVTTMESYKYPVQNVPFPGIAICNINKISKRYAMELALELSPLTNYTTETIFESVQYFGRLYDYEVDDIERINLLGNIIDQSGWLEEKPEEISKILERLAPKCHEMVLKCIWQGEFANCSELLSFRMTMDGFCCTFNYKKFLSTEKESSTKNDDGIHHPSAGLAMGLTVVLRADLEDYYYPLTSSEGLSVKVFNSFDYPDGSSGGLSESFVLLEQEMFMQISATTVQPVDELRSTTVDSRACIFENEGSTAFDKNHYSYSDCLAECKMKSILAICDCIPFFMPVLSSFEFSKQICTLSDIKCLNKYRDKWINIYPDTDEDGLDLEKENSVHCPHCLPSCGYVSYSAATNYAYLVETIKKDDLVEGLNLTEHTVVHMYFGTEYTTLYKTDLFYYWFDIISNFGGICSLFLGFSLISVVELAYFFTFRYFLLFKNKDATFQ